MSFSHGVLAKRFLPSVLSVTLALAGIPAPALAQMADEAASTAATEQSAPEATPQAQSDKPANPAPEPPAQESPTEAQPSEPAPAPSEQPQGPASGEDPVPAAEAPSETETPAAATDEAAAAPAGEAAQERAESQASGEEADTPEDEDKPAGASATEEAPKSAASIGAVFIQDSKDKTSYYSTKSGALKPGETLWANAFTSSYGSVVPNDGTFSYQWFAGSAKSSDPADYPEAVGTEQSLTVTDALQGKYLICRVTAGEKTLWGPNAYSGVNTNYLPGPVLGAGQLELYKVTLDSTEPSVGDTLHATAYESYSDPVGPDTQVTWEWQADGIVIAGATQSTLTLDESMQGKVIKVSASAGVNTKTASTSAVAAKGSFKLYQVSLDTPASTQVGVTLTAHAYKGTYSNKTEVTEGVTYTWYQGDGKSYSTTWTPIAGQSGPTLEVTDALVGKYVRVSATAGANTVDVSYYSAVGPFKLEGAYDIYTANIYAEGETSGNNAYTSSDTLWAVARETSGGPLIPADALTYQWMTSERGGRNESAYTPLVGQTGQTLSLTGLEGLYVGCKVTAKVGGSSYFARVTKTVAAPGSVNVTSVKLSKSGEANPGDTITATASDASGDVTAHEKVQWAWWVADSSSGPWTKIDGADTPSLTLTDAHLNCYLKATAEGGYGPVDSTQKVGPVTPKGAVNLHHVEVSGDAVIGGTLTATAYKKMYDKVAAGDVVTYVWEYATSNTTSDLNFQPIGPASNEATLTIPAAAADGTSLVGTYVRVRAMSKDRVVSTYVKGSYSSSYKDPLGPVRVAGGYDLSKVLVSSSGQGAQAGSTLTPKAQYLKKSTYGSYDADVPDDAQLTYTWYVADGPSGEGSRLASGVDAQGKLTLSADLVGKYVWCTATALMKPATSTRLLVRAAGDYDLLRAQFARPTSTTQKLVTGNEVAVDLYAKRLGETYSGTTGSADKVTDKVGDGINLQWYVAPTNDSDAAWTPLAGATQATLTIPPEAADCYLKAVAHSGADASNEVSVTYPQKVVAADSLAGIVALLEQDNWRPEPQFGRDTNVNDLLMAHLKERGIDTDGLTVATAKATFSSTNEHVSVGVATDEEHNGDITYLWADLDEMSSFYPTSYQQATLVFTLERAGESVSYEPARRTIIGWDEDKATAYLEQCAARAAITYAQGDSAESVTSTLTLPKAIEGTSWARVQSWESASDALSISGSSWASEQTGTPTRGSSNTSVTLTAQVGFSGSGMPSMQVAQDFELTILADPEKVSSEIAQLEDCLKNNFTYDTVRYATTGGAVDHEAVVADLQLPTPRTLGVDGKYYQVRYDADEASITPHGYRGVVVRPLPGSAASEVQLSCTITSKANPEVTARKTLRFVVEPTTLDDLDAELALMDEVKAAYLQGIINGNDPLDVTDNLHGFKKAYRASDGSVAWAYDVASADAQTGIVAVELPGYDAMGPADQARLFSSSAPQVLHNETLLLGEKPAYDTVVTVASVLSSERYAAYYDHYRDDPTLSRELREKLANLVQQPVQAQVTIKGSKGADTRPDSEKSYTVPVTIVGPDAQGKSATWATVNVSARDNDGQTAADATRTALAAQGLDYVFAGSVLEQVSSPVDGSAVANEQNGAYWQLWICGSYSEVYATGHYLKRGDSIVWQYGEDRVLDDDAPQLPQPQKPADTVSAEWGQSQQSGNVTSAKTPTTGAVAAWEANVRVPNRSVSEPLIALRDGVRTVLTFSGSDAFLTNAGTGKVTRVKGVLKGSMSLTTRPILHDGVVYVPLNGGKVQAIDLATLKTLWTSEAVGPASHNATCSARVIEAEGKKLLLVGTSEGNDARAGALVALDAATGERAWSAANATAGYFWTDAVARGAHVVAGDSAGVLHVFDAASGRQVATKKLSGAPVNADIVAAGDALLVMSRDGVLRKVTIDADGMPRVLASVKVGQGSTAAPTIVGNRAICTTCGPLGDDAQSASIVVVNIKTMKVEQTVSTAGGKALPGGIKTPALVSSRGGAPYCYVTCNDERGRVYVWRLGDREAKLFYVPRHAQFCDSPLVCDAEGNLYYLNDAGVLVKLKAAAAPADTDTKDDAKKPAKLALKPQGVLALRGTLVLAGSRGSVAATEPLQPLQHLLADMDSSLLTGVTAPDVTDDGAPEAADTEGAPTVVEKTTHRLPLWPLVGMAAGALVLLGLVVSSRKETEEEA